MYVQCCPPLAVPLQQGAVVRPGHRPSNLALWMPITVDAGVAEIPSGRLEARACSVVVVVLSYTIF